MYNLRYHIASLTAVFLALSIGLLLGTIVVERGILDRQRELIVSGLQKEFRVLREENTELRERVTSREELSADLLAHAVAGQLQDRRVLVIAGIDRIAGLDHAIDATGLAGGSPVVMSVLAEEFGLADPELASALAQMLVPAGAGGAVVDPATLEADHLLELLIAGLVREWGEPVEARPLTNLLVEADVVRVEGETDPRTPIDGVVTLAILEDVPERGALLFARALAERGLPGVGAEAAAYPTHVATAAVEMGLSAVDHLGTEEGTVSLVFLLAERTSGYFGLREGATAPWPQ